MKIGYHAGILSILLCLLSFASAWGAAAGPESDPAISGPLVRAAERHDVSAPLKEIASRAKRASRTSSEPKEIVRHNIPRALTETGQSVPDRAVQSAPVVSAMPVTNVTFEGMNNLDGYYPPDTVGAVGPNHYVQMVNVSTQVYSKTGTPLLATPVATNSFWAGFGGACETSNDGDPIVLYDQLADRWVISQFAIPGGANGYHECIAVSTSPDPTGSWYRYDFLISATKLNDYPKLAVWPDGYYMSINQFTDTGGGNYAWGGAGAVAFDRAKMLAGQPASMIYFDLGPVNLNYGGMLPSHLDGTTLPPAGAPNVFMQMDDSAWGYSVDQLSLWNFHVDWTTPANSTFGVSGAPTIALPVAGFDTDMCNFNRNCIPQSGTTVKLDPISDRLMFRLAYRNFGDHEAMVVNHTVDTNGTDHAGIRWYELRKVGAGSWSIYQQSTHSPDAEHRWMGSVAMDWQGNMALGYSASSATSFPSIRYAGRLASDPLGNLSQGEAIMMAGTGAQTGTAYRWGDYSAMTVDPTDDCTFWYTQEYYQTTSNNGWQTRIGSFKFPSCTAPPPPVGTGTLSGTVTAAGGVPLAGVTVTAGANSTLSDTSGAYQILNIPAGNHAVTAAKYGYSAGNANVTITESAATTQDFSLSLLPLSTVSGTVNDGSGHGWPLSATIAVTAPGLDTTVTTDPVTGTYSINLAQGVDHAFSVTSPNYLPATMNVLVPDTASVQNFTLVLDSSGGSCPVGYQYVTGQPLLNENFDGGALPSGWSVTDNTNPPNGQVWVFNDPKPRGNLTGGANAFAIIDSDYYNSGGTQDSELRTPTVNLTGKSGATLEFKTDFRYYSNGLSEKADVDISINGAAGPWTTIWSKSGADYRGPKTEVIDISALAANKANVMVRFHYYNAAFDWWWEVDDVKITPPATCQIMNGGLVKGYVNDANTGSGINGAFVLNSSGSSLRTGGTGYYSFFLPTGSYTLFSMANLYGSAMQTASVSADSVLARNFSLQAGRFSPSPTEFTLNQYAHSTASYPLSIANTGGASASFSLDQHAVHGAIVSANGPPNPWTTIASPMPTGVSRAAGAAAGGKFYVIGGQSGGGWLGQVQTYDPATGQWDTSIAPMPYPAINLCAGVIGTDIYIPGGMDSVSAALTTLQVLHTATGIWETVSTDPLPDGRYGAACAAYKDKLYVFGGSVGGGGLNTTLVYDPAGPVGARWTTLAPMPVAGYLGAAVPANNAIMVSGLHNGGDLATVLSYDPGSNQWTEYPSLINSRGGAGMWVLDNILFVGGGGYTSYLTTVEQYDLSLGIGGSWSYVGPFQANSPGNKPLPVRDAGLNQGRRTFAWATDPISGRLYAAAGYNGAFLANAEDSRIDTASWLSLTPLQAAVNDGSNQPVSLTVNTEGLTQGSTYRARIALMGNTPYGIGYLPVTLNVLADAVKPTVSTFAVQTPVGVADIPVLSFAASDNSGAVAGYLITESSAVPLASNPNWSPTAPAFFHVSAAGTKQLYAWAKDGSGNVSDPISPRTAVVGDSVKPDVDAFGIAQDITSYLRGIIAPFSASDNFGVTGYLVTESAMPPAAGASGWSGSPQTSFTFATPGDKAVFAWAKDAAGNVSNGTVTTVTLHQPARIDGPPMTEFPKIQDAYDAIAGSSDSLRVWAAVFAEAVNFNRAVAVDFRGGYDTAYGTVPGRTEISGTFTVTRGSAIVDRITVR